MHIALSRQSKAGPSYSTTLGSRRTCRAKPYDPLAYGCIERMKESRSSDRHLDRSIDSLLHHRTHPQSHRIPRMLAQLRQNRHSPTTDIHFSVAQSGTHPAQVRVTVRLGLLDTVTVSLLALVMVRVVLALSPAPSQRSTTPSPLYAHASSVVAGDSAPARRKSLGNCRSSVSRDPTRRAPHLHAWWACERRERWRRRARAAGRRARTRGSSGCARRSTSSLS